MATLTEQLLSVTRALPPSPDTPGLLYKDLMRTASDLLNSIPPPAKEASLTERAQLATRACTTIFKERAIVPEHEGYEKARQSNWSCTCWLPAACFVKCQNNMEVAVALKTVKHFECRFAIRGAGHNGNPGVSSAGPDGVVIDVSALNHIKLSEYKQTVSIGPGATWDQVYSTLEPHKLTVVGGRVAGVGVGGLIAGGGMSHYSNAWGVWGRGGQISEGGEGEVGWGAGDGEVAEWRISYRKVLK